MRLFNIQRFSLHDGPGLRTVVFFKGCPLHCPWCSNPESQRSGIEQMYDELQCVKCSVCKGGTDADACLSKARTNAGFDMLTDEVMKIVLKDSTYYTISGGGVTLSGGEVLLQASAAFDLLRRCKAAGIHTAIETSGCAGWEDIKMLLPYLDLIMFDIKIINDVAHRIALGHGNGAILENYRKLSSLRTGCISIIVRFPLIPGYTDTQDNIADIAAFLLECGTKRV